MTISKEMLEGKLKKLYSFYTLDSKDIADKKILTVLERYHLLIRNFDENALNKALNAWITENNSSFPTPMQLKIKCCQVEKKQGKTDRRFIAEQKNKEEVGMSAFICENEKYFNLKGLVQTQKESELCNLKSIHDVEMMHIDKLKKDLENSRRDYGLFLCEWHQLLVHAKISPNSHQAMLCKISLGESYERSYF